MDGVQEKAVERWQRLVATTRGALEECEHRGAIAVVSRDGALLRELGDTSRPVFARSALKPLQALAAVESGAADRYGFGGEQLALMCSSHSGEPRHTERVADMLARIGCGTSDLQCGCHAPLYLLPGDMPPAAGITPLHHNCSGKHAGFLACCRHWGTPTADYLAPDSTVQRAVRAAIARRAGVGESELAVAIDGCSAPTYALPLRALAQAYARLAADDHDIALARLRAAMIAHPELVSGTGRSDNFFMSRGGGEVVSKVGAEGVQALGLRARGIGVAIKIADGNPRAAAIAAAHALRDLGVVGEADWGEAPPLLQPEVRNARGIVTGATRAVFGLA